MGRVTFQDPLVVELVNREFCANWKNLQPGYRVEHLEGDRFEQIRKIPNGQASENVLTVIATPEGELLHAIPGHWKPKEFRREIEFAISVAKASSGAPEGEARREIVREKHRNRLAELARDWQGGELGRRVIERAHQQMIARPLRSVSEIRGFAEYALDPNPGSSTQTLLHKKQQLQHRLQSRLQDIERLMREGNFEKAEATLDEFLRQLPEERTKSVEHR